MMPTVTDKEIITAYADTIAQLRAEVDRLTARVAEVTEQAKRAGDRVDATEVETETLRRRVSTLTAERDAAKAEAEALRNSVRPCTCHLTAAEAQHAKGAGTVTLPALEIDPEADAQMDRMLANARNKAKGAG